MNSKFLNESRELSRRSFLRLLFIVHDLHGEGGGAERVTLNLLRHFDRERFKLTLFAITGTRLHDQPDGVECIVGLPEGGRVRDGLPRLLNQLIQHARRSDVVVGALERHPTYLALAAASIARKPAIGWVHTSLDVRLKTEARWHRRASIITYPKLSKVVFVSQGAADSIANLVTLPSQRSAVIPNLIELTQIQAKAQEPLPAWTAAIFSKPVVLGLGRLSPQKGFDLLLHAHANLRAMGVEHHLLILGEGSEREALEKLCHQLDVTDSVFMPGFFPNPYPFLRAAQVFALSSRFEGLPSVIIEALCLRVPVVAADCPSGPHELLNGGEHGMLVPLEDPAALAEGIASILRNPASAGQRTASGYERAQDFSPERVVPQWEALLRTVTNGGRQ